MALSATLFVVSACGAVCVGLLVAVIVIGLRPSIISSSSPESQKSDPTNSPPLLVDKYRPVLTTDVGKAPYLKGLLEDPVKGPLARDFYASVFPRLTAQHMSMLGAQAGESAESLRLAAKHIPIYDQVLERIAPAAASDPLAEDAKDFLLKAAQLPVLGLARDIKDALARSNKTPEADRLLAYRAEESTLLDAHLEAFLKTPKEFYLRQQDRQRGELDWTQEFCRRVAGYYTLLRVQHQVPFAEEANAADMTLQGLGTNEAEMITVQRSLLARAFRRYILGDLRTALQDHDAFAILEACARWLPFTSMRGGLTAGPWGNDVPDAATAGLLQLFMRCIDIDAVHRLGIEELLPDNAVRTQYYADALQQLQQHCTTTLVPAVVASGVPQPVVQSLLDDPATGLDAFIDQCNVDVLEGGDLSQRLVLCHNLWRNIDTSCKLRSWQSVLTAEQLCSMRAKVNANMRPLVPIGLHNPSNWCFFNSLLIGLASVFQHLPHWQPALTTPLVLDAEDIRDASRAHVLRPESNTALFQVPAEQAHVVPPDRALVDLVMTLTRDPAITIDFDMGDWAKINQTAFRVFANDPESSDGLRSCFNNTQQDAESVMLDLAKLTHSSLLFGPVELTRPLTRLDNPLEPGCRPRIWVQLRQMSAVGQTTFVPPSIPLPQTIEYPLSDDDSDPNRARYQLRAAVFKTNSQESGHYVTYFRAGREFFLHNDLAHPRIMPAAHQQFGNGLAGGMYCNLAFYVRSDEGDDGAGSTWTTEQVGVLAQALSAKYPRPTSTASKPKNRKRQLLKDTKDQVSVVGDTILLEDVGETWVITKIDDATGRALDVELLPDENEDEEGSAE